MKIKTNCLPKWSNATLITCLDKSHALREIGKQRQHVDSITWDEGRENLLLPLAAWQTHCLIPFCPHSNSNNNIANSSCIEFIFVYHLVLPPSFYFPFYFKLWRDFHIVARRCELCVLCCSMCVCVCLLCWLSSRLRLLSSVCCLHTVHNVRIKLFSHYPVHSGFIKKFTMRCRSRFVGQPRTAEHILNHTHSSWHTHAHNVTDMAYHVSAIFQLLHRECFPFLSFSPSITHTPHWPPAERILAYLAWCFRLYSAFYTHFVLSEMPLRHNSSRQWEAKWSNGKQSEAKPYRMTATEWPLQLSTVQIPNKSGKQQPRRPI